MSYIISKNYRIELYGFCLKIALRQEALELQVMDIFWLSFAHFDLNYTVLSSCINNQQLYRVTLNI